MFFEKKIFFIAGRKNLIDQITCFTPTFLSFKGIYPFSNKCMHFDTKEHNLSTSNQVSGWGLCSNPVTLRQPLTLGCHMSKTKRFSGGTQASL